MAISRRHAITVFAVTAASAFIAGCGCSGAVSDANIADSSYDSRVQHGAPTIVGRWVFVTMAPPPPSLVGAEGAAEYTVQYALSVMDGFELEFTDDGEVWSTTPADGRRLYATWSETYGGAYEMRSTTGAWTHVLSVVKDTLREPGDADSSLANLTTCWLRQPPTDASIVGEWEYAGTEMRNDASAETRQLVDDGRATNEGGRMRFDSGGRCWWRGRDDTDWCPDGRWLNGADGTFEVRDVSKLCYVETWTVDGDTLEQHWMETDNALKDVVSRWKRVH